jgi:hypothetical protein
MKKKKQTWLLRLAEAGDGNEDGEVEAEADVEPPTEPADRDETDGVVGITTVLAIATLLIIGS